MGHRETPPSFIFPSPPPASLFFCSRSFCLRLSNLNFFYLFFNLDFLCSIPSQIPHQPYFFSFFWDFSKLGKDNGKIAKSSQDGEENTANQTSISLFFFKDPGVVISVIIKKKLIWRNPFLFEPKVETTSWGGSFPTVLRGYSWLCIQNHSCWGQGDRMGYEESNSNWLHARQASYPLYCCSSPQTTFLMKSYLIQNRIFLCYLVCPCFLFIFIKFPLTHYLWR